MSFIDSDTNLSHLFNTLPARFVELLAQLIRNPSVVGSEHSFFRVLQRELEERDANVTWYEGLLVAQGTSPSSMYVSAHIDRHGLMCTGPNEFQYAAFVAGARSDLLGNSVSEQLMSKIVQRFVGNEVYAYEPWSGVYRGKGLIESAFVSQSRNNLIFNVSGLEYVVAGTPVAFEDKLKITNNTISGQLDNVLTAAVLVYLFECGYTGTVFFTAQEEAGKSWRFLLEWFRRFGEKTNQLLVVDTSPFPDLDAVLKQDIVLRNKDANASFNIELTKKIEQKCHQLGIHICFKDEYIENLNREIAGKKDAQAYSLGSTELGRIISASKGLVDGTTIQIPSSAYHTIHETAAISSIACFIKLVSSLNTNK